MKLKLVLTTAFVLSGALFNVTGIARGAPVPVGFRLTGHASMDNRIWQFEIVMEGYDLYYRKEWSGDQDPAKPGSEGYYIVALAMTDFGGEIGRSWSMLDGGRGGGHSSENGRDMAEVARRLWQGDKFRGVATDELREMLEAGHDTEEFGTPISQDNFPIPTVIKWTDNTSSMPNKTTIYTVENVEFTYLPNPQFFADARKKYFSEMEQRSPLPKPARHEQPSESQKIAADALEQAKLDREGAIAKLRAALARFPLEQPLGAWNQCVLLAALWQIRGLDEKDELVDWFYRTLPLATKHPMESRHGYMDHGPWYLLFEIAQGKRPEIPDLLKALVADPRFDQTDPETVVALMERSYEGFPIPQEIPLDPRKSELPNGGVQRALLPLWRNILRRHYGLPEEPLPHEGP